jgi:hypothetical protein
LVAGLNFCKVSTKSPISVGTPHGRVTLVSGRRAGGAAGQ